MRKREVEPLPYHEIAVLRGVAAAHWHADQVAGLLAAFDRERGARSAAEADAERVQRAMRDALDVLEVQGFGADGAEGVAKVQAVCEAARRAVAESQPDSDGVRQAPSRESVDALADALSAMEGGG